MKEYVITLVGVCLFCGFITVLSPDGEGGGIKKHIKLIASLCVLSVMIAPLVSFAESLGEYNAENLSDIFEGEEYINKYEEICNDTISAYTADEIARRCKTRICAELGMESESFEVEVATECVDDVLEVSSVRVTLHPAAITQDPREISAIVSDMLDCECEIIYS